MSILVKTIKNLIDRKRRDPIPGSTFDLPAIKNIQQLEGGAIISFLAASEGNALADLTREMLQPFAKKASKIIHLNLNDSDWFEQLKVALQEPVWFARSSFGVGQDINFNLEGEQRNLWETTGIPFVRVFGDIPAYFPDKHVGKYTNSINAYSDTSHFEFYRKWFEDQAFSVMLPQIPIEAMPLVEIDKVAKQNGKIIFPKNGNSPEALIDYWRMSLPSFMAKALESVVEECISKNNINLEPHIDDHLLQYYKDIDIDISAARSVFCFMVAQVDDYLRRLKSTIIAQAILDLPVIIRGKNWGHVNFSGKKAVYDSNSDFSSTRKLIDDAPAIIDMSPNTVRAPHDRVCRAAGRGTAFLTNKNEYMPNTIGTAPGYAFLFDRNSIHDIVEYYVLHPDDAIQLGLAQAHSFREKYTPERHYEALLSAIQTVSFKLGTRPMGTQNFVDFPPKYFR